MKKDLRKYVTDGPKKAPKDGHPLLQKVIRTGGHEFILDPDQELDDGSNPVCRKCDANYHTLISRCSGSGDRSYFEQEKEALIRSLVHVLLPGHDLMPINEHVIILLLELKHRRDEEGRHQEPKP